MKKISGIYEIKNLINSKKYIGQSADIVKRERMHFWMLRNGKHKNPHLQNAYNKYGEDNFIFKIIEKCAPKKLTAREQFYVDNENRESLYNIRIKCVDSNLGVKPSAETLKKMSVANKNPSAETRKKMSKANTGKKHPNYGKHTSFETRAKISNANSGEKCYMSKLTWDSVHFIREHKAMTLKGLAKKFAVNVSTIYSVRTNRTWKE